MSPAIDPAVLGLITACAVLLFGAGAVHKLRDPRRFTELFAAYQLLPARTRPLLSRLVPYAELAIAAGLAVDVARPAAAAAGVALLLVYAAAICINLMRGRFELACGCGGPDDRNPIAAWMVWRNLISAALLSAACLPPLIRPLTLTDAVTVGFGTATCALVYLCIDRLLARPARGLPTRAT